MNCLHVSHDLSCFVFANSVMHSTLGCLYIQASMLPLCCITEFATPTARRHATPPPPPPARCHATPPLPPPPGPPARRHATPLRRPRPRAERGGGGGGLDLGDDPTRPHPPPPRIINYGPYFICYCCQHTWGKTMRVTSIKPRM